VLFYQGWSYWVFRERVRRPGDPVEAVGDGPAGGAPSSGAAASAATPAGAAVTGTVDNEGGAS
jgi:hypothetical protein